MTKITYAMSMIVDSGPAVSAGSYFNPEAYDVINITAPKTGAPIAVEMQPGETGDVQAIVITSDNYTDLTYTVDTGDPQILDAPLMLIGAGNVGLLGATQNVIEFTNNDPTKDARITILVAREAVEPGA